MTAQERARQFQEDLYVSDGVLFCKFCEHSVDFVRVDTIKDHLKSKNTVQGKLAKLKHRKAAASNLHSQLWLRPKTCVKSLCLIISRCVPSPTSHLKRSKKFDLYCESTALKQELCRKISSFTLPILKKLRHSLWYWQRRA